MMAHRNPTERLTDADRAAICEAYAAGEPIKLIAERFGVAPNYPGILVKRMGQRLRARALYAPSTPRKIGVDA
jgi:transposase-like protein